MALARVLLLIGIAASSATATYTISSFTATPYGYTLQLSDKDANGPNSKYPSLTADVIAAQSDMVRIRVKPTEGDEKNTGRQPYVIPDIVFPQSTKASSSYTKPPSIPYEAYVDHSTGSGVFVLAHNNKPILTADFSLLTFQEQFVSFTYSYPKQSSVSGFMERNYKYFLDKDGPVTLSLWNTDNGTPYKTPMYASYPIFWLNNPHTGTHFAVLNMNAHAQQATVDPTSGTIKLVTVGGILDLHVFLPSSNKAPALEVVQAYQRYVGPAAVPPYWSLGKHQCRWGYKTLEDLKAVPEAYKKSGIPLEVLWNDIDYMENFKVFTYDPVRYAGLPEYVRELQAGGQKYIQIVDPGVATQRNYGVYESGEAAGIFMKLKNKTMVGVVWPGWTAFPDFSSSEARQWWVEQIHEYSKKIKLDGMWTDMNEIASFCGGACPIEPGTPWDQDWETVDWGTFDEKICKKNGCAAVDSSLNFPPFNPLDNNNQLFTKTPDMEADLALGKYYETKMFYANLENIATNEALLSVTPNTRPFILSRAAFVGAGRSTFHWLGDNSASFDDRSGGMVSSINGNMGSNLGGIFMVGADLAGFGGAKTTEELADRWYQLGSYYTFMRNHRALGPQDTYQEPYLFSDKAQASFIKAINRRYRLLPYLFSSLMEGTLYGTPVTLHPSVVFSDQPDLYEESTAFMLGTSLFVAPAVTEGSDTAKARLPSGLWYNLADEDELPVVTTYASSAKALSLEVPRYSPIPAFQRAGTMIAMHKEAKMLVAETKATGYSLVFALGTDGRATGRLILDTNDQPITESNVFVLEYAAVGTHASGHVTVSSLAPLSGSKPNFPELIGGKVVVMFPQSSNLKTSELQATVDDALITATNPTNGKFIFYLGANINIANFETLRWTAKSAVVPAGDESESAPEEQADKWKVAFVASASFFGVALVLAATGLAFLVSRQREDRRNGFTSASKPLTAVVQ